MKKVPIFAEIGLATIAVVVGLSWDARVPVNPKDAVPAFATVSVRPETIQLFSAFGGHSEKQEFPQPVQPTTRTPEIKADAKKLRQSTKDLKPATNANQKRPPAVPDSGHIL
jgi:hypothetical protein